MIKHIVCAIMLMTTAFGAPGKPSKMKAVKPTPVAAAVVAPMVAEAKPSLFSGFTVGISGGYGVGWAKAANNSFLNGTGVTYVYTGAAKPLVLGPEGGLLIGYLHQKSAWGFGVDFLANFSAGQGKSTMQDYRTGGINLVDENLRNALSLNRRDSLQARGVLSYVIREWVMPKIFIGWDNTRYSMAYQESNNAPDTNSQWAFSLKRTKRLNGIMWGAGVDFSISPKILCGVEYTGVRSATLTVSSPIAGQVGASAATGTTRLSLKPIMHTLKFTVRYRIG